jgi:hypothetical protein
MLARLLEDMWSGGWWCQCIGTVTLEPCSAPEAACSDKDSSLPDICRHWSTTNALGWKYCSYIIVLSENSMLKQWGFSLTVLMVGYINGPCTYVNHLSAASKSIANVTPHFVCATLLSSDHARLLVSTTCWYWAGFQLQIGPWDVWWYLSAFVALHCSPIPSFHSTCLPGITQTPFCPQFGISVD